jgi:hypothetical protein
VSPELITAFASIGTLLVIAASAVAALVQLRHLRKSNQLSGLLSVLELFQQPHFHELINFVRSELPSKLQDPAFREGLECLPVDRRSHPELHVADMYEEIGSYVRAGLIDEDLFLLGHWLNVLLYWSLLEPCVAIIRSHSPRTFENFEYLAARALIWNQNHPRGNYPRGLPRVETAAARNALTRHWLSPEAREPDVAAQSRGLSS